MGCEKMPKATIKASFEARGFKLYKDQIDNDKRVCPACGKGVLRGANLPGYDHDKYVACCACKTGFRTYECSKPMSWFEAERAKLANLER